MKTILITGGTDGMGKALAITQLKKGYRVIIVGRSKDKGAQFINEAKQLNASNRAIFLEADLSLISENKRIIEIMEQEMKSLDTLILTAADQSYRPNKRETREGFEFTFALYYLSRYVLSYGLKSLMEKSNEPIIINISAPGLKGEVKWDNIQMSQNFDSTKAQRHGSRLNDLLAVSFDENNEAKYIKYILFNPWAVRTKGADASAKNKMQQRINALIYKLIGKSPEEAILPVIDLLDAPPKATLSAYLQRKEVDLSMPTFDKNKAKRLFNDTNSFIKKFID
ncbi:SDR family NAD(P)-dependent oxidoreductase [Viridibacillus arvi]|uniref:SDR family NAD(P)-dependent oxidoreductase n=1 Tax=Viridibacillus arvi TaxID=263475 RepID=UPI003D0473C1